MRPSARTQGDDSVRCRLWSDDPSVAVAAHALGNAHMRRGDMEEAAAHMEYAMGVYTGGAVGAGLGMGLKDGHPLVSKLRRDMESLDRIIVSAGYR